MAIKKSSVLISLFYIFSIFISNVGCLDLIKNILHLNLLLLNSIFIMSHYYELLPFLNSNPTSSVKVLEKKKNVLLL